MSWGHYSLIQCEMNLLKQAVKGDYAYYHLLSGSDLPLKPQEQILAFFDGHQGKQFVHFDAAECPPRIQMRIRQYHFTKYYKVSKIVRCFDRIFSAFQSLIHFQRQWPQDLIIQKGAEWFSITDDFAKYVVSKEKWIKKYFSYSLFGDELFLQTILYNSRFKNTLYMQSYDDDYRSCMRYIDWSRGTPYTFRNQDFQELTESFGLFARKFSSCVDSDIIEKIFSYVNARQEES